MTEIVTVDGAMFENDVNWSKEKIRVHLVIIVQS